MKHSPRIGISGWTYVPWRGTFYPADLVQKHELEFASRQVNSIEINGAFYSLPRPTSFEKWYDSVPKDFVFSVKAPRFITHIKRLNDVEEPICNFFASGLLKLKQKLGPILWQFPPNLKFDADRFETFLKLLPHDFKSAAKRARGFGPMLQERHFIPSARQKNFAVRHAVEVRHSSFMDPRFTSLLERYGVAAVLADSAGKYPEFTQSTSDFRYVRLHGARELYVGGYTPAALESWARKVRLWIRAGSVFVYFDNDVKVQAPFNAVELLTKVIKGYQPAQTMDAKSVRGLKTPGPRLVGNDRRWRR